MKSGGGIVSGGMFEAQRLRYTTQWLIYYKNTIIIIIIFCPLTILGLTVK